MSRTSMLLGLAILSGVLVVSATGQTSGTKEGGDPPVKKVQLPTGWKKLGLSDEQKKKIYALRRDYAVKIKKLSDQIDALKKEEPGELGKLLTEEQKVQLRKLALEKVPQVKDKKPEEKKSGN